MKSHVSEILPLGRNTNTLFCMVSRARVASRQGISNHGIDLVCPQLSEPHRKRVNFKWDVCICSGDWYNFEMQSCKVGPRFYLANFNEFPPSLDWSWRFVFYPNRKSLSQALWCTAIWIYLSTLKKYITSLWVPYNYRFDEKVRWFPYQFNDNSHNSERVIRVFEQYCDHKFPSWRPSYPQYFANDNFN